MTRRSTFSWVILGWPVHCKAPIRVLVSGHRYMQHPSNWKVNVTQNRISTRWVSYCSSCWSHSRRIWNVPKRSSKFAVASTRRSWIVILPRSCAACFISDHPDDRECSSSSRRSIGFALIATK
uniref:Putative secreted peptide n=1 Tax=Anopheles braziliensis TaxID=58242 RepID=A0A2M3ZVW6_9DIPT